MITIRPKSSERRWLEGYFVCITRFAQLGLHSLVSYPDKIHTAREKLTLRTRNWSPPLLVLGSTRSDSVQGAELGPSFTCSILCTLNDEIRASACLVST